MARYAFHEVGFKPGTETVRLTVRAVEGIARGALHDLYSLQARLQARQPLPGVPWSDAEAIAETIALLAEQGDELVSEAL